MADDYTRAKPYWEVIHQREETDSEGGHFVMVDNHLSRAKKKKHILRDTKEIKLTHTARYLKVHICGSKVCKFMNSRHSSLVHSTVELCMHQYSSFGTNVVQGVDKTIVEED